MLKLKISNFKTIEDLEIELAPLTVLLGPPAAGKSNILDAISLAGYFNKLLLLEEEYENVGSYVEPLTKVARFSNSHQLFRFHQLTKKVAISLTDESRSVVEIFYEKGEQRVCVNGVSLGWDLVTLSTDAVQRAGEVLRIATEEGELIEARLYGYDRYGLMQPEGFPRYLTSPTHSTPKNVLSELGWNAANVVEGFNDITIDLNTAIQEGFGEKIEVKVLLSGAVAIFDYDKQVETASFSDSIFRMLYSLIALRSAANYAKLHGLEKRFVLMLEEPEAHVFPFFLTLLADYVAEAVETLYVVVTTHNPLLVSALWDKVKDVKTYYVVRDSYGATKATEIDVERLAKDALTAQELLLMPPRKAVEKYSTEANSSTNLCH